jgi:hypothetical protein
VEADRAGRIELFNLAMVQVTRYRYRGNAIATPWTLPNHPLPANRGEPGAVRAARRVRRAAGQRPGSNPDTGPQADSTGERGGAVCVEEKS